MMKRNTKRPKRVVDITKLDPWKRKIIETYETAPDDPIPPGVETVVVYRYAYYKKDGPEDSILLHTEYWRIPPPEYVKLGFHKDNAHLGADFWIANSEQWTEAQSDKYFSDQLDNVIERIALAGARGLTSH
jgi:hypothetical protein